MSGATGLSFGAGGSIGEAPKDTACRAFAICGPLAAG